jgi:hypothetical protein
MVHLASGGYKVKKGEYVHNELVGLSEPTPFISALYSYTAKADAARALMGKEKGRETLGASRSLARHIKALSLNPSIYDHNLK